MNRQTFLYIVLFNICLVPLTAQEVVLGLHSNIQVRSEWENSGKRKGIAVSDTLELPFLDDFSKPAVYPDQSRWIDNYVYINNTYSNQQKTAGIATFDAIDNTGRLYESGNSSGFKADQLTSKPINLKYSLSDNVYFSFFFEPAGLGDEPEVKDSLTLQFYAPSESKWYSIWHAEGSSLRPFKAVIIPVNNVRFLKKGFQFRFVNYASLSSGTGDPGMIGNCDMWNIDYVFLNKNRNSTDTIPADVAFTLPVRSILKSQEAMPWRQFRKVFLSEMGPWIQTHYMNNDKIVRNVTRNYEVTDLFNHTTAHSFSAGATIIDPNTRVNYNANLLYTFSSANPDSALFLVKSYMITDVSDPKQNDTIVYYQRFSNYFAYDDGTSEAGYGINGLGSRNAMVAYRFKSFIADTLRAIRICFNDSYQKANLRTFDLMLWSDNNGIPGDVVYIQEEMTVKQSEGINGFYTYVLNDPQPIDGIFYVGWKQRSETFLNSGFDVNTPHSDRQFYWLNGNWNVSQAKGTLMIRPVVGPPIITTSLKEIKPDNKLVKIWPNPVNNIINIDAGDLVSFPSATVSLYDNSGREVMKKLYSTQIDVTPLPVGIYSLVLRINGKQAGINRFIKVR